MIMKFKKKIPAADETDAITKAESMMNTCYAVTPLTFSVRLTGYFEAPIFLKRGSMFERGEKKRAKEDQGGSGSRQKDTLTLPRYCGNLATPGASQRSPSRIG